MPPIRQFPDVTGKLQVPSPLQLSAVHNRPSLHVYEAPLQCPVLSHTSFLVHESPSLHVSPAEFAHPEPSPRHRLLSPHVEATLGQLLAQQMLLVPASLTFCTQCPLAQVVPAPVQLWPLDILQVVPEHS